MRTILAPLSLSFRELPGRMKKHAPIAITRNSNPADSTNTSKYFGGGGGNRTHDIQLAKLTLSQLSYTPTFMGNLIMVGLDRLELSTSRLSGVRSNHLSYRPL